MTVCVEGDSVSRGFFFPDGCDRAIRNDLHLLARVTGVPAIKLFSFLRGEAAFGKCQFIADVDSYRCHGATASVSIEGNGIGSRRIVDPLGVKLNIFRDRRTEIKRFCTFPISIPTAKCKSFLCRIIRLFNGLPAFNIDLNQMPAIVGFKRNDITSDPLGINSGIACDWRVFKIKQRCQLGIRIPIHKYQTVFRRNNRSRSRSIPSTVYSLTC